MAIMHTGNLAYATHCTSNDQKKTLKIHEGGNYGCGIDTHIVLKEEGHETNIWGHVIQDEGDIWKKKVIKLTSFGVIGDALTPTALLSVFQGPKACGRGSCRGGGVLPVITAKLELFDEVTMFSCHEDHLL